MVGAALTGIAPTASEWSGSLLPKVDLILEFCWLYVYCHNELSICSLEYHLGVYFPSYKATQEINAKMRLSWPHQQFPIPAHTLSLWAYAVQQLIYSKKLISLGLKNWKKGKSKGFDSCGWPSNLTLNWIQIIDFPACATFYTTSSFMHHFYPLVNSNWSYSPEMPNLGQNRRFFIHVTLKFNGWPWKK